MFQFPAFASYTLFYSGVDTFFTKVGCPIRKSTDQRVFAPPRSLSQRITSFIACACQGIHQMPLRHLIVLIANIHSIFSITIFHAIKYKAFVICLLTYLSTSLCLVQNKAQNKHKYQQKRPASRDILNGAVKLPIISKGFEHSLATHHSL